MLFMAQMAIVCARALVLRTGRSIDISTTGICVFSFRQENFAVLQMTNNLKFNFKFATWFGTLKRQNECYAECGRVRVSNNNNNKSSINRSRTPQ